MGFESFFSRSRSRARSSGIDRLTETLPWSTTLSPDSLGPTPGSRRVPLSSLLLIGGIAVAAVVAAVRLSELLSAPDAVARSPGGLQAGLLAGGVCLLLLALLAVQQWRSRRIASETLRRTVKELRRGAWESAVAGLRQPRRAASVPSAFGELASQVEGVLSESERRWRARAELSTDWYWELDERHRLSSLSADAPIAKPAGRALGDLLGRRHDEWGICQPPAGGWAAFHLTLDDHKVFRDLELEVAGLGERKRGWVAISGRPRFRRDGRFAGYEGVGRDITEPKLAFRRLQASEQRHALMAGMSADWYWCTDAEHRFGAADAELSRRLGALAQRMVGRTLWECHPDALSAAQWQAHRDDLQARRPFRALEYAVVRDDGHKLWFAIAGAPRVDELGRFAGYHGVGRDITLRKMAEQLLVQNNRELQQAVAARTRELEMANRDLDAFARQLAHELRTPIGHVQGLAELLRQHLGEQLTPGDDELLALQIRASRDMLATLEALLELARSSSEAIERQEVDLSQLADEVISLLPRIEREAAVQWRVQPGLRAWASASQMRIVLHNLLGNAAKFTRHVDQPEVLLTGTRDAEGQLTLRVVDNGAGFDDRQVERLFRPFQRLHRQDDFQGTGIGLTIVQRIVQRHGGTISALGSPGRGASFELTLNQRDAARPPTLQAEVPAEANATDTWPDADSGSDADLAKALRAR